MPRFQVQVFERETGRESVVAIEATTINIARELAGASGYVTGAVLEICPSAVGAARTTNNALPAQRRNRRLAVLLGFLLLVSGSLWAAWWGFSVYRSQPPAAAMVTTGTLRGELIVKFQSGASEALGAEDVYVIPDTPIAGLMIDRSTEYLGKAMEIDRLGAQGVYGDLRYPFIEKYKEVAAALTAAEVLAKTEPATANSVANYFDAIGLFYDHSSISFLSDLHPDADTEIATRARALSAYQLVTDSVGKFHIALPAGKYVVVVFNVSQRGRILWAQRVNIAARTEVAMKLRNENAVFSRRGLSRR